MLDHFFRVRPHWHALTFHYGMGIAVASQLVEDLLVGHQRLYGGELFPWGQIVDWTKLLGPSVYAWLGGSQALLLCAYVLRLRLRVTATLLSVVLLLDNLGSFTNHRSLMAIEVFLVGLVPVPRGDPQGLLGKKLYWNLDLVRWQISVVYVSAALHKLHPQFLRGHTLDNLFFMLREHGMRSYSDAVWALLSEPAVCLTLAWSTLLLEAALAVGLNRRSWVGWLLPAAIAMHVGMASLMAYIWVFSAQMILSLIAFVPDRTPATALQLCHAAGQRPPRFLACLVPGAVHVVEAPGAGWWLETPGGAQLRDWDAWLALLSLSPLTFVLAETLRRIRPAATATDPAGASARSGAP